MSMLRNLIRFAASPVFFALAWFNYVAAAGMADHMAMMDMGSMHSAVVLFGRPLPDAVATALQSMWLMYALMGMFHSGAWLSLGTRRAKREAATGDDL